MKNRKKTICIIILNILIAVSTFIIAGIGIARGAGDGQVGTYVIGWGYLKPYTMDSNIFSGIVAIIVVIVSLVNIKSDKNKMPKWLALMHLMGTTCLVLTFLIAAFFLAPIKVIEGGSYFTMFSKDMFFFHLLNPVLSTVSFILCLKSERLKYSYCFIGMIPTIIYSVIYFVMVVVVKKWMDFYHFTFGGRYYLIPAVVAVIYGLVFAIAALLVFAHNKVQGE